MSTIYDLDRLVLTSLRQTCLINIPLAQHFMYFDLIDWNRAFFKMYYEKRGAFARQLQLYYHIWFIHISLFWFYTTYNAPTI